MKKKMSCLLVLALSGQLGQAQDSIPVRSFDEFIVTANRSKLETDKTPRSVTVIGKEQIAESGYQNLAELLSMQQGISVIGSRMNPGSAQSLFTRGTSSNHTVVMMDGIPLTDPSSTNRALELSEISLANVERIEIIRGTHSTLYGSSAIGGVINIITKEKEEKGFHADVNVLGGTFGKGATEFNSNAHINMTTAKGFYLNADVFNSTVNGMDATVDTVTNPNTYHVRDDDDFLKTDIQGVMGFKNEKTEARVLYKHVNQITDIDKAAYQDDDNYQLTLMRNIINYHTAWHMSDRVSIGLSGGVSDMLRQAIDDSSIVDKKGNFDHTYSENTYSGKTADYELQSNLHFKHVDIVAGSGYQSEAMNQKSYYYSKSLWGVFELNTNYDTVRPNAYSINTYIHADINGGLFSENMTGFNLTGGCRYDQHSKYGPFYTFELNPSVKAGAKALIFGSYSTGFNAPSLYQLYATERNDISSVTRGNPGLKPERSYAFEFGIKEHAENVTYSVSIFKTVVKQTISYVYLWDGSIGIDSLGNNWLRDDYRGDTYLNLGKQINTGLDLTLSARLTQKLQCHVNMNIANGSLHYAADELDTSITHGHHVQLFEGGQFVNTDIQINELIRRSVTANLAVVYRPVKQMDLRLEANHVGPRSDVYFNAALGPYGALGTVSVADYTLLNFAMKFSFSDHLSASLRINNFENKKYTEINGFTTKGRVIYFGFRLKF